MKTLFKAATIILVGLCFTPDAPDGKTVYVVCRKFVSADQTDKIFFSYQRETYVFFLQLQ